MEREQLRLEVRDSLGSIAVGANSKAPVCQFFRL
jgi:hypothetical protein